MTSLSSLKTVDRAQDMADMAKSLPPVLQGIASKRYNHLAHITPSSLTLEFTTRAQDLLSLFVRLNHDDEYNKEMRSAGWRSQGWSSRLNKEEYISEIQGRHGSARAGLENAMEELDKSGLLRELELATIGLRKRRKRVFSDTDGDFDYSRKDEDYCFTQMRSIKKECPSIEVIYPVNFNSGASNESISVFHARCMALAGVLQQAGYRVGLTGENWSRRSSLSKKAERDISAIAGRKISEFNTVTRSVIREPGEYGDLISYAPIACSEYYRLVTFDASYALNHINHGIGVDGKNLSEGNFSALSNRPIPTQHGQLVLSMDVVAGLFELDEAKRKELFKERILHTIGGTIQAAS